MLFTFFAIMALISTPVATPAQAPDAPDNVAVLDGPATNQPLIVDDAIFLVTASGSIVALDASSGETTWNVPFADTASDRLIHAGNLILVPGHSGTLYALDMETGNQVAANSLSANSLLAPVVLAESVLIADVGGSVFTLDPDSLDMVDQLSIGQSINLRPVVIDQTAYFVVDQDLITAVDIGTMEITWQTVSSAGVSSILPDAGGELLVGDQRGQVSSLSPDGTFNWTTIVVANPVVDMALAGENVVVSFAEGSLVSLRQESGETVWNESLTGSVRFASDICATPCMVVSSFGAIFTLDPSSGATHEAVLPSKPAGKPADDGRIFVVSLVDGTVLVWHHAD